MTRLSEKQFTQLKNKPYYGQISKNQVKNKYGNVIVERDGMRFHSVRESDREAELTALERGGLIRDLERQVPFVLFEESEYGNAVKYIADFVYWDITQNKQVVEDVKGYRTPEYKLKKRIMAEKLGIDILET